MDKNEFFQLYDQMGIKYDELPESYTPDSYARTLLSNESKSNEVSYAASTTVITDGMPQNRKIE